MRVYQALHPVPVIYNLFNCEIPFYMALKQYPWLALGSTQVETFDVFQHAVDRIKVKDPALKVLWFGGSRYSQRSIFCGI